MQNKSFIQKLGKIILVALVLSAVAWFASGAIGAGPGLQKGLVGIILVFIVFSILLAVPPRELKEKTFFQNLY